MSALHYKEFQGSVDFEDGRLIIRLLHIDDLVTTEIDSATQAQCAFEELVDDYIQTCIDLKKEPCKPFKGTFNVRVAPELHRQVAMAAVDKGQSMNGWISDALEFAVEHQKTQKSKVSAKFALDIIRRERVTTDYHLMESITFHEIESHMRQATEIAREPLSRIKQQIN